MSENITLLGFSDPISSWTHLLSAVVFLFMGIPLVKKGKGNTYRVFSLILFTFSLVFLFSMSGVFHILGDQSTAGRVLMRLDHAAIWVLIAGTFTPVHVILFRGIWRWGFLTLIWTIAITGLVLKTVFFESIPNWAGATMFLGLGWMGAISAWKIVHLYGDRSIRFLIFGALAYTIGTLLDYFLHWPVLFHGLLGPHEIFHLFVILGAYCHWLWVYSWADCPVLSRLQFTITEFPDNRFIAKAHGEAILLEAPSLQELKAKILEKIDQIYHHKLPAEVIHIKYSREEIL